MYGKSAYAENDLKNFKFLWIARNIVNFSRKVIRDRDTQIMSFLISG
jgi:hypothetical protein